MAASEDVQYFQFDESGNIFVFKPGSGFSGPCVKVDLGFEMHEVTELTQNLSVTENVIEALVTETACDVSNDSKEKLISVTPTPVKR